MSLPPQKSKRNSDIYSEDWVNKLADKYNERQTERMTNMYKWYYLPANKWFRNRKEVKDYLGGTIQFNVALRRRDVIFIQ